MSIDIDHKLLYLDAAGYAQGGGGGVAKHRRPCHSHNLEFLDEMSPTRTVSMVFPPEATCKGKRRPGQADD